MKSSTTAAAAVVLVALAVWGYRAAAPGPQLRDYGSFVASGRAAAQGLNPYGIHPLTFHVVLPGFEVWNPNLNPPVSIPLFAMFDRVDPHTGFRLWWALSFGCYAVSVLLLMRRYGAGPLGVGAVWAFALAGFWDTLALGQIYLPLVLLAVVAWLLLERGRDIAAGALIGLVVAMKPNFAVWPVLLFLSGRRAVALTATGTFVLLWMLPLAVYGADVYRQWFAVVVADPGRGAFLTNAALPGLMRRLGIPSLGTILSAGILAALAWWAWQRERHPLQVTTLGILGGIVASPIAWVHYTLFLLPAFFASRLTATSLGAAALLVVPVPLMLRTLDGPLWQQLTLGSVYNWAMLLCLVAASGRRPFGVVRPEADDHTRVSSQRLRVLADSAR